MAKYFICWRDLDGEHRREVADLKVAEECAEELLRESMLGWIEVERETLDELRKQLDELAALKAMENELEAAITGTPPYRPVSFLDRATFDKYAEASGAGVFSSAHQSGNVEVWFEYGGVRFYFTEFVK